MASINKITLIGHLGQDPERVETKTGTTMCNLSVATNRRDGETDWHRVKAFGQQAGFALDHLKKGAMVYIEGTVQYRKWEKDGDTKYFTDILANQVTALGGKSSGGGGSSSGGESNVEVLSPDEGIPF